MTLSQTQRQLVSNLYSMYNEALTSRSAADNLRRVADLASESLRLIALRYQAGESTALRARGCAEHARPGAQCGRRHRGAISRRAGGAADADRKLLMIATHALSVMPSRPRCWRAAAANTKKRPSAVVTVDVAPVLLSKIQRTIRADGLLYPRQQAAIVPKVSAPVKKVYVQRGARVRAGQLARRAGRPGSRRRGRGEPCVARSCRSDVRDDVEGDCSAGAPEGRTRRTHGQGSASTPRSRCSTTGSVCIGKARSPRRMSTTRRST